MKYIFILLTTIGLSGMTNHELVWTVGTLTIKEKPVVFKFLNKLPSEASMKKFHWLTIVSWKYDGSTKNGMPPDDINKKMIKLEDGLEKIKGENSIYMLAYTATGNNLKEFVFYIKSRKLFMDNFNKALLGHPTYPLEINFYDDPKWTDHTKLLKSFENATETE